MYGNSNYQQQQQQYGQQYRSAPAAAPQYQHQQYSGVPPPHTEQQRLHERLVVLQREKGEVDGMLQILRAKLSEAEEDNFELRANALTVEVELAYEAKKKEEQLQKQMASMESRLSFLTDQFKNAERAKLRALRELEELQQKQLLEQKRLDAEKRLLATKKRKHESVMIAASQTLMTRMQQSSSQATTPPSSASNLRNNNANSNVSTSVAAVQTESLQDTYGYAQENAELLSKLMSSFSRDLLTLFNGANGAVPGASGDGNENNTTVKPPTPTVAAMRSSTPHSEGSVPTQPIAFSQSVFSQIAGQAQAQAQASMLSFAMETNLNQAAFATERAKDLYDTLGKMLNGETTVLALAPVFIKYLAAPTDLDVDVLSSVMRVMYFVMHHSERFQRFLLISGSAVGTTASDSSTSNGEMASRNGGASSSSSPSSLMDHPRISLPGLKFASLDDYLASRNDHKLLDEEPSSAESASELKQQRSKLLSALCRVIRNYVNQPVVVEHGLCVLSFWVDLGIATPSAQPDFKPLLTGNVIQDILLAPKGLPHLKRQALNLLTQLLHFHDIFPEIEASAKKSLLFNRCAKMLLSLEPTTSTMSASTTNIMIARDMKRLQLQIVHVLLAIVMSFPSTGIRFVLEATRGHANDADGHRSVIYYLAQLLHQETFEARISKCTSTNISTNDTRRGIYSKSGTSSSDWDCTAAAEQRLLRDPLRMSLVRDAFTLMSLLVRYVDLGSELDGAEHEHAFLSVLHLLSTSRFDSSVVCGGDNQPSNANHNDSISKTARALISMTLVLAGATQAAAGRSRSTAQLTVESLRAHLQHPSRLSLSNPPAPSDNDQEDKTPRISSHLQRNASHRNSSQRTLSRARRHKNMRAVVAIIVAFAALLQSVAAQSAAPVDAPAPYDKTCFELPVVIVSPIDERLPTETCNQQRYPAIDCMKKPVAVNLEVIDNANGTLNCLNGPRTATYPSTAHYRGQSSLHFSKHQMSVKLDEASEFLGFPADQKFVLNGPVIDSTLMRNHLAQWLFRQTTRYSPRSRHIVVFIRDRLDTADNTPAYKGIYLALEKISYGPNRVGLAPLSNECKGSELNGGWAWQNNPLNYGVYSPNIVHDKYQIMFGSGERPVLMHPGAKVLTQSMRDYFVDTKTGPLPRMYEYLYENMTNTKGFEEVIDIGSFVDYFLHSEMSQNSDAYRRSTYFFKDRDQPINAGPVWDFNLAYGTGANQKDWLYKPHTFWKRLFCNYKFASLVPKRWRELRASVWSDETISYFLGNSSAPIARQLEHCSSWTSSNLQCANTNGGGTFMGNVDSLERTVLARARWMDDHVAGFYMKLNFTVCEPAGPIPTYNCAEDGDDDGCLTNPEKYINAVEFPSIRKPSEDKPCASASAPGASNEAVEEPSIDPCWLSAGVYVKDGSITPFCSGYGSCPPGPGAKCMCTQGRKLPTCARSDDPITVPDLKIAAHASGNSAAHSWTRTSEVLAFMGVMVAMCGLFVFLRNRREKKRQATMYPPVLEGLAARDQGTSLQYGTS